MYEYANYPSPDFLLSCSPDIWSLRVSSRFAILFYSCDTVQSDTVINLLLLCHHCLCSFFEAYIFDFVLVLNCSAYLECLLKCSPNLLCVFRCPSFLMLQFQLKMLLQYHGFIYPLITGFLLSSKRAQYGLKMAALKTGKSSKSCRIPKSWYLHPD